MVVAEATLDPCVEYAVTGSTHPELKSNREKDENYWRVVAVLNPDWRVIECIDGIQWIIQKRCQSRWISKKYLRDRASLIDRVATLCRPANHDAMASLEALPAWIHLSPGWEAAP